MDDGIETGNVVRYIMPAAYWVTNANNIVSHNVAAGSSQQGY